MTASSPIHRHLRRDGLAFRSGSRASFLPGSGASSIVMALLFVEYAARSLHAQLGEPRGPGGCALLGRGAAAVMAGAGRTAPRRLDGDVHQSVAVWMLSICLRPAASM